ncbi:MAG: NrsF family protein [Pseudomonadota bacterium]
MKTEALIRALSLDAARPIVPLNRIVGLALAAGVAASVLLFTLTLRPRADFPMALYSPGFLFKMTITICLALTAATLLGEVARPLGRGRSRAALALAPALLVAGVAIELFVVPGNEWHTRLIGRNAPHCVLLIPMLSAVPAALLMLALRRTAPARPGFAGIVIGLTAGGIGAGLYALSCPDDSPLFVATWYSFAIAVVAGICFIAGKRWLRW